MAKPIHATATHSTHMASKKPQLITTETTARNLHAVALALSIGAPTLLEGVTGAGKTTLVEELAIRTGRGDRKYMGRDTYNFTRGKLKPILLHCYRTGQDSLG